MAETSTTINISISREQIVEAIKKMDESAREAFIEDLIAMLSPAYLESIREARQDYKAGRTYSHKEVFG